MEDFVNFPRFWQFQLVSHQSQDFFDFERSFSFRCHLLMIICLQMFGVQPYYLSFFEWSEIQLYSFCHLTSCQLMCSQCFFSTCDQVLYLFSNRWKLCVVKTKLPIELHHASIQMRYVSQILFFLHTCRTCFHLLFFIYDQHAFTSRQTCLFLVFTSFLHYALHVFASRLTHFFTYLNQQSDICILQLFTKNPTDLNSESLNLRQYLVIGKLSIFEQNIA